MSNIKFPENFYGVVPQQLINLKVVIEKVEGS